MGEKLGVHEPFGVVDYAGGMLAGFLSGGLGALGSNGLLDL